MKKDARDKARELREAQASAERRRRTRINLALGIGLLAIVGLLVAIVVVAINSSQQASRSSNIDGPLVTPANATDDGSILIGQADAPVTLEIFLDYMCPACKQFEEATGPQIGQFVQDGTVKVELHPMNFLDPQSRGTMYSTRAANAVATVANEAPAKVWDFNNALFAQQPHEGTTGLTDKQIADIAVGVGVPQSLADTFTKGTYEPWVVKANESANKEGVTGTPTLKINGQKFEGDVYSAQSVAEAVLAAAGPAAGSEAGSEAGDQ